MAANQDTIIIPKRIKVSNGMVSLINDEVADFSGVTYINTTVLKTLYTSGPVYGTPNFQNLQGIFCNNALDCMFQGCLNITGALNFQNLTQINGNYALRAAFSGCTGLTGTPNFQNLTQISGMYCIHDIFTGCTGLTGYITFPKLHTVATDYLCAGGVFQKCTGLTGASFPKLKNFGENSLISFFKQSTGMTEVHFRADLDATHRGYCTKTNLFGGETSTYCHPDLQILFDLTDES